MPYRPVGNFPWSDAYIDYMLSHLVSLVDGFNLPMEVTFTAGIDCPAAGCPVDLIPNCEFLSNAPKKATLSHMGLLCALGPDPLKGPFDSNGIAVGCKSACSANLDGNPSELSIRSSS